MNGTGLAAVPITINERRPLKWLMILRSQRSNSVALLTKKQNTKKCADEVGLSMSDFIRSLLSGKEKLVLLSEGAEIAKALFLIHTDLEYFRNNGGIPEESARAITLPVREVKV
jgi:hypothetical protein